MSVLIAMQVSVTLALGGLLGATVAEGAPPASQAGRQPGLFAFEAGGVFTIRADGTGNREIVFDGHDPEWSPDGSRLLYDLGDGGMGDCGRPMPKGRRAPDHRPRGGRKRQCSLRRVLWRH